MQRKQQKQRQKLWKQILKLWPEAMAYQMTEYQYTPIPGGTQPTEKIKI